MCMLVEFRDGGSRLQYYVAGTRSVAGRLSKLGSAEMTAAMREGVQGIQST